MAQADSVSNTSRRGFLGSAVLTAAVMTPVVAASATQAPDADLLELGRQYDAIILEMRKSEIAFRPYWQKHKELLEAWKKKNKSASSEQILQAYERLWSEIEEPKGHRHPDKVTDDMAPVEEAILALPATTIAGLAVKARVAKEEAQKFWETSDTDCDWDILCARKAIDAIIELAARQAA